MRERPRPGRDRRGRGRARGQGRTLRIGRNVRDFEAKVAELFGKRRGIMCNSGSSALYLAVELLGLSPGDEVVTSAVTFSTDVAPLVRAGLVPAFVDVEPDTYNVDVGAIPEMIGEKTKAILAPNLIEHAPTGTPSGPSPTNTASRWWRIPATPSAPGCGEPPPARARRSASPASPCPTSSPQPAPAGWSAWTATTCRSCAAPPAMGPAVRSPAVRVEEG